MKDMQLHLETLRSQIGKCERLRDAAKGEVKRAIFERIVAHYKALASELDAAISQVEAEKK